MNAANNSREWHSPFYKAFIKAATDEPLPPPPELPAYDINQEAPKWDRQRLWIGYPAPVVDPSWPRVGLTPKEDDKPDWRGILRKNVQPMKPPEKYSFGKPQPTTYWWFDTPDYADPFKKLWYSFKFFTHTGIIISSAVGVMRCLPMTVDSCLTLFRNHFGPWMLGGMTASFSVLMLANLRGKKDDYWNYVAAGLIAAATTGRRDYIAFWRHSLLIVPTSVCCKYSAENNLVVAPVSDGLVKTIFLSGNSTEDGFWSGDLRLGIRGKYATDPGRIGRSVAI